MKPDRLTRVNELLRREIGQYLFRVMTEQGFDLAAVTVTHVITSHDLRNARVLVSIRDHQNQRQHMLNLIERHRAQIQHQIAEKVILKYTPRLSFSLDTSVEDGDRVLNLLQQLAPTDNPAPDAPPSGAAHDE